MISRLAPAVTALLLAFVVGACGSDSSPAVSPGSTAPGVTVSLDSGVVGTYATQEQAAERASTIAGFTVFPVTNLPDGLTVSGFVVGSSALRQVQVFIRGSSGGLLLSVVRGQVGVAGGGTDVQEIPATAPGKFYVVNNGTWPSYDRLTDDRMYTLLTRGNITQDQAITILSTFPQ